MKDCRDRWLPKFVYLFKSSNIQIFRWSKPQQIPSKSQKLLFFCLHLEKSLHVRTGCFFIQILFLLQLPPNIQHPNLQHTSSYIRRRIPTIHQLTSYFSGRLWESEMQNANCDISLSNFWQNIHIYAEKGVWNDFDEKDWWHKITRGPSKLLPNLF
jgi:hypothetical protein